MSHRAAALFVLLVAAGTHAHAQATLDVSVSARAIRPGEAVLFTVRTPVPAHEVTLQWLDRTVVATSVDTTTWVALAGLDLDTPAGRHDVAVEAATAEGPRTATVSLSVRPGRFPTRRLRVDPVYVEPPADVLDRIRTEAARLDALWAREGPPVWGSTFGAPVDGRPVGRFGARSVFNGQPRAPHAGEDYAHPIGTPIVAPGSGTVVLAEDLYFTGTTLVVDHGGGLLSLFAHLSSMEVAVGDAVVRDQLIGRVGATGRVTGPHLHWSVRLGGARVDPSSVVAVLAARGPSTRLAPLPR